METGSFEDIIAAGMAQPIGAAVGLLYSETADIYYDSAGTYGAELRALYIALKHAGLPIEILIEEDCEESVGRLHYIDVLYVTMPHISDTAAYAHKESNLLLLLVMHGSILSRLFRS